MIVNLNTDQTLYVVGESPTADNIMYFLGLDYSNIQNITAEEFYTLPPDSQFILGVFNTNFRLAFFQNNKSKNCCPTYIHPDATVISPEYIGKGSIIWPKSYLGCNVKVGNFCIVSQFCSLGHSATLGNNCVLSPGTIIGGSTQIGDNVYFGQSSSIKDKINICNNVEFAMTSVVTRDITESGEYFGSKKSGLLKGKFK